MRTFAEACLLTYLLTYLLTCLLAYLLTQWCPIDIRQIEATLKLKNKNPRCVSSRGFIKVQIPLNGMRKLLFLHRFLIRQVSNGPFIDFSGQADGLVQGWVSMHGQCDIFGVAAHFNRQAHFAKQFTGV